MKILWHGPHPDMPTGYATQTALLLPRFKALGYEVAVSCTAGQDSHPGWWNGIPVLPCTPYADCGEDVVTGHYSRWGADIVFTFLCTWYLKYPQVWRNLRTVHITPVDCDPMSWGDYEVIAATNGTPAAISRFGEKMMRAGVGGRDALDPLYLPHGVDMKCFAPSAARDQIRTDLGYDGSFVVAMNFMNNDRDRKNTESALRGFAMFHEEHSGSLLAVHAIGSLPHGMHVARFAEHLGISSALRWSPEYELVCGMITPPMLADWYNSADVLLNIGNEGFGLPALEAQACGTPVILGDWTTGPELAGPGWLVGGQPKWNEKHRADHWLADPAAVAAALGEAHEDARNRRESSRDHAAGWDINMIVREHWEPVLETLS